MATSKRSLLVLVAVVTNSAVSACRGRRVASTYRSMDGVLGGKRPQPHNGIDIRASYGAEVLAAAAGTALRVGNDSACGISVFLSHKSFGRYTFYCHLAEPSVRVGDYVERGAVIGLVGTTGSSVYVPHVHVVLTTTASGRAGNLEFTEDPLSIMVGCFNPAKTCPDDRLVLTYPVRCDD